MQNATFTGRLAKAPTLTGNGDKVFAKFTLISNEYVGRDERDQAKTKAVSIQFTAFRGRAETIARNCMKGDQLIVVYSIENNNYDDGAGNTVYGYNFIVEDFEFGAPGAEKREQLAHRDEPSP